MSRSFVLLLSAVAGTAVLAAPAPLSKTSRPWYTGWDQPVDSVGDCRFHRKGDRLTITVPDKGHELNTRTGKLQAPCLLRDVDGDFAVEVRVGGTFRPTGKSGSHQAGLLLTDGRTFLKVQGLAVPKGSAPAAPFCIELSQLDGSLVGFCPGWDKLSGWDGTQWHPRPSEDSLALQR